jgi:hypothetical protein
MRGRARGGRIARLALRAIGVGVRDVSGLNWSTMPPWNRLLQNEVQKPHFPTACRKVRCTSASVVLLDAWLYSEGVMRWLLSSMISTALLMGFEAIPMFEQFRVSVRWNGPNAAVKLARPDERMFRTRLSSGASEPPNFAGHYRFVGWGCGSVCAAGAFIDLETGIVYPPPRGEGKSGWDRWIFAGGFVDEPIIEVRPDSRLVIIRQQARDPASQEVRYYEWSGTDFRLLTQRLEKRRSDTSRAPK